MIIPRPNPNPYPTLRKTQDLSGYYFNDVIPGTVHEVQPNNNIIELKKLSSLHALGYSTISACSFGVNHASRDDYMPQLLALTLPISA